MTQELKLRPHGNSVGAIFPKEVLARLNAKEGDTLFLTEAPDGFRITAADPNFKNEMESAEKIMRRYRNTLRELAK